MSETKILYRHLNGGSAHHRTSLPTEGKKQGKGRRNMHACPIGMQVYNPCVQTLQLLWLYSNLLPLERETFTGKYLF
jgi:hypothetical protein